MRSGEELPDFLMTSEPGSFAQETILQRKPQIIRQVLADNSYPSRIVKRLTRFEDEILNRKIEPLTEPADDTEKWNSRWQKYANRTWLQLPWYFAETYFYRRLLEAVEYFQPGPLGGRDPFRRAKKQQLEESLGPLNLATDAIGRTNDPALCFENLLHASLWGNRIDLSKRIADEVRSRQATVERENLLINDFSRALVAIKQRRLAHIAFVNDNVGAELGFDLLLADFLLTVGWVDKITFYLKPYPFFVSDAMPKDVKEALASYREIQNRILRSLGERMQSASTKGALLMSTDWFWASPYHFSEMPRTLYDEFARLDLVVLKGDVNYRRLLSDRHWPYTMPTAKIASYFPAPLLILRTLKGEIMTGLKEGQAEKLAAEDPEWLTDGRRGIIQYLDKE